MNRGESRAAATRQMLIVLLATGLVPLPATRLGAHEIPVSVRVQAFVKPEGSTLRLLVRVPLESMRDVDFPLRGIGLLELDATDRLDPRLREAVQLWIADYVTLFENDKPVGPPRITALRVSAPSEAAFVSFERALAHTVGPALPAETELYWQQALLDVLFDYPIASDGSEFAVLPEWAHLGQNTTTILRFLPPAGEERVLHLSGDPGLIRLDPRWHQAAAGFGRLGFFHILEGIDHLLFLLCLVIPFRRIRPLVALVTSFTIAHSITLIASALGFAPDLLWFPPLIEALIALSIVFMAFENIVGSNLQRRCLIAFAFGLVHGFGFSFALRESLQLAGSNVVAALLAFNVGVELGQIFVLLLVVPALGLIFRHVFEERLAIIILSALVAHTAWHWMSDRYAEFREHPLQWPAFDLAFAAGTLRALMILLILGVVARFLFALLSRWTAGGRSGRIERPGAGPEAPVPVVQGDAARVEG
jgi:hypothetical protein